MEVAKWIEIFQKSINAYHVVDNVDTEIQNPYPKDTLEHLMYLKNWVDTVQWHLEDIIRDPQIEPVAALKLKRRIDASNQHRTDLVEFIDSWLLQYYSDVNPLPEAVFNTESPAWAIDRLSILELKIYHMQQEVMRPEASAEHKEKCQAKLDVLLSQREDLSTAIQQ